jgi:hypothetical protein
VWKDRAVGAALIAALGQPQGLPLQRPAKTGFFRTFKASPQDRAAKPHAPIEQNVETLSAGETPALDARLGLQAGNISFTFQPYISIAPGGLS